jgi:hypothetical protein
VAGTGRSALPGVGLLGFPRGPGQIRSEPFHDLGVQLHRQAPRSHCSSSIVVAPTIMVETTGFGSSQASATSAGFAPSFRHSPSYASSWSRCAWMRCCVDSSEMRPDHVDNHLLEQFPEFQDFKSRARTTQQGPVRRLSTHSRLPRPIPQKLSCVRPGKRSRQLSRTTPRSLPTSSPVFKNSR